MALNNEEDFEKIKDIGRAVFLITFNEDYSKVLF